MVYKTLYFVCKITNKFKFLVSFRSFLLEITRKYII